MLGFGALELRGALHGREVSPKHAERVLNTILDSGINFIDTSIDYGQSEDFIGRYISHRRSEYYLATKCGCVVGEPTRCVSTARRIANAGPEYKRVLHKKDNATRA